LGPPPGQSAGVDPIAVGAGVRVGAVTNDQSQGAIQQTNQPTDVAIQGAGFLVASQQGQQYYTRAGNLTLDANGNLATPTGALIQGWQASGQGVIDTNAPVGSVITVNYTDPSDPTDHTSATATIHPAPGVPGVVINKTLVSPSGGQVGVGLPVTLTGVLTSQDAVTKNDAEGAVKRIEGVEKVVNNIEVLPPSPADDRIRRRTYEKLMRHDVDELAKTLR
jgi:flagellar hook protein FlgE